MTITQQVENILRYAPATRNSDKELMIVYMQKFGMELTDRQVELFKKMPAFETIRRVRQKLQEVGSYQAVDEVKREREFKAMQMQQITPGATPEYVDRTLDGRVILPWGE